MPGVSLICGTPCHMTSGLDAFKRALERLAEEKSFTGDKPDPAGLFFLHGRLGEKSDERGKHMDERGQAMEVKALPYSRAFLASQRCPFNVVGSRTDPRRWGKGWDLWNLQMHPAWVCVCE